MNNDEIAEMYRKLTQQEGIDPRLDMMEGDSSCVFTKQGCPHPLACTQMGCFQRYRVQSLSKSMEP